MDVAIYDPISCHCPQKTGSHGMYLELSAYQETTKLETRSLTTVISARAVSPVAFMVVIYI